MRRLLVLLTAALLLVPALAGAAAACRMTRQCPSVAAMGHDCCPRAKASLRAGCCDREAPAPTQATTASERIQPPALLVAARQLLAPASLAFADAAGSAARPFAAPAELRSVLRI